MLSEEVIKKTLAAEVKPINPHSQRLLAAEARSAKKVPTPKAKAGLKPKPKNSPAPKSVKRKKGSEPAEKPLKKSKPDDNSITPTRTEYSAAKKKWMDGNLDSRKVATLSYSSCKNNLLPSPHAIRIKSWYGDIYTSKNLETWPTSQKWCLTSHRNE